MILLGLRNKKNKINTKSQIEEIFSRPAKLKLFSDDFIKICIIFMIAVHTIILSSLNYDFDDQKRVNYQVQIHLKWVPTLKIK